MTARLALRRLKGKDANSVLSHPGYRVVSIYPLDHLTVPFEAFRNHCTAMREEPVVTMLELDFRGEHLLPFAS